MHCINTKNNIVLLILDFEHIVGLFFIEKSNKNKYNMFDIAMMSRDVIISRLISIGIGYSVCRTAGSYVKFIKSVV